MICGTIKLGTKGLIVILPSGSIKDTDYVKLVMIPELHPFYIQKRRVDGEDMVMEDGASIHRSVVARETKNRLRIQWTLACPVNRPQPH